MSEHKESSLTFYIGIWLTLLAGTALTVFAARIDLGHFNAAVALTIATVKALLVDESQIVVAEAAEPLSISRPHPLWSEQDPEDWWSAVGRVVLALRQAAPRAFGAIRGLGRRARQREDGVVESEQRHLIPGRHGVEKGLHGALQLRHGRSHAAADIDCDDQL